MHRSSEGVTVAFPRDNLTFRRLPAEDTPVRHCLAIALNSIPGSRRGYTGGMGLLVLPRRRFLQAGLALAGSGLPLGCRTVTPQGQHARRHRIGFLSPDAPDSPVASSARTRFVEGLRDLGYVEGQTIEIVYRWAEEQEERLPALAAELVALPVDVILAVGVAAGRAAKEATATIPIVVGASGDPVEAGLVESLARPGGNVTGLSTAAPLLVAKRVALLAEAVPSSGRFAALGYASSVTGDRDWAEAQSAARALGLELTRYEVRSADEFDAAFAVMAAAHTDALLILPGRFFAQHRARLLSLVAQHRLPAMFGSPNDPRAGGLMSYGADVPDQYRRAATYVDKILKGATPANLPVEQPTTFELVLNLKTAQALGITIPPSVLAQATELIQ